MDEQSARVAALFDRLAADYDQSGVDFFEPIADGLLAHVPPREGERWLDVGCGRGAVLLPAAAAVGAAGQVVGIDIAASMVERVRDAAAAQRLTNVEVTVADATAPPAGRLARVGRELLRGVGEVVGRRVVGLGRARVEAHVREYGAHGGRSSGDRRRAARVSLSRKGLAPRMQAGRCVVCRPRTAPFAAERPGSRA